MSMNTGSVIINSHTWNVAIATTYDELTSGLSGVESLPANQGVLFDLGETYYTIDIYLTEMLFPIDAVFIGIDGTKVVGVTKDMQASEGSRQVVMDSEPARYFMEVNAGELDTAEVEVDDDVVITQDALTPIPPTTVQTTSGFDMSTLNSAIMIIMLLMFTKFGLTWAMKP